MSPFDFFDAVFCINLDSRSDRWENAKFIFEQLGIQDKVIRIPGTLVVEFSDPKRNACYGNALSHAKCLERTIDLDYQNCLIFEDDLDLFHTPELTLEYLFRVMEELPKDWELLYLGANMDRYSAYQRSAHIAKLDGCFSTHAYAINRSIMRTLINANRDKDVLHNDVYYAENIIPTHPSYVSIPLLFGQTPSYSNIEGRIVSSNQMFLERFEQRLIRQNGI